MLIHIIYSFNITFNFNYNGIIKCLPITFIIMPLSDVFNYIDINLHIPKYSYIGRTIKPF